MGVLKAETAQSQIEILKFAKIYTQFTFANLLLVCARSAFSAIARQVANKSRRLDPNKNQEQNLPTELNPMWILAREKF
jgi:hypothetical protein